MQSLEAAETIHLLPLFDAYTIGMPRDIEPVLAQAYKSRVFRLQGWITAVILINGSIQGVWQYTTQRVQTVVKVQLFTSPTGGIRKGIEAEVERLAGFFKKNVLVEYEDP
jgi:Winged helix DNA-binding domain